MSRKGFVNATILVAAAAAGIYLSRGPWIAWREQRVKAAEATSEMEKAEKSRTELLQQKAKVESPQGQEAEARKRGYVKPGEVPVEVSGQ